MEDEEKLEVTDKRRVSMNGDTEPAGGEAGAAPVKAPTAPEAAVSEEDEDSSLPLPPMDVYGLIKTTIGLLSNGAWAWMGLSPSPFTGEMEKDLVQAKVAIDTVALLVEKVEASATEAERRELQNMVSMLRLNYVQQSSR